VRLVRTRAQRTRIYTDVVRIRIIDAFTDRPFAGNPAGVCLLEGDAWPADSWMHDVASELDLPMTAFARPLSPGGEADWALRWFNAAVEERFCGHATLATAYALHTDRDSPGTVRFTTHAGVLIAHSDADGTITMDFPANPVVEATAPDGLAKALGVEPDATYRSPGLGDVVVLLADEATVGSVAPDFAAIDEICRRDDIRGVIVTAPAEDLAAGYDFVSRFFDPAHGIPEDSVTGSAHTELAPLWSERLGRDDLTGLQRSARTGLVHTSVRGDRVLVTGHAVTVLDGSLLTPPA
jgi:PhzF family phenazine biosynthesis protein